MSAGIPTVVAGDLVVTIGHEGDLCRTVLEHQSDELRDGIAFNVELRRQQRLQVAHVLITDMALVGTGVNRDALSAEALAVLCHAQHVGIVAPARIANSGYFIDVYTEFCGHNSNY